MKHTEKELIDHKNLDDKRFSAVTKQLEEINKTLKEHLVAEVAFHDRLTPVVEAYEEAQSGGKLIAWIVGTFITLGSAWIILVKILRI